MDVPLQRLRILIVEDDYITARDVAAMLERRGYPVTGIAHNVISAAELLAQSRPDLVLLDIQLGEGGDSLAFARDLSNLHAIPVIYLTGYSPEALIDQARATAPVGFLRKPFSETEVASALETAAEQLTALSMLKARLPGIEAFASELPEAVLVTDLNHHLVYLNPAATMMTGWNEKAAIGRLFAEVAPFQEPPANGLASSTEPGGKSHLVTLTPQYGSPRLVSERSSSLRTPEGDLIGLVTIFAVPPGERTEPVMEEAPAPLPTSELPARSSALSRIAQLAQDPAFRDLLGKRSQPPTGEPNPSSLPSADSVIIPPPLPVSGKVALPPSDGFAPAIPTSNSPSPSISIPSLAALPTPTFPGLLDEVGEPLLKIGDDGSIIYANTEAIAQFGETGSLVGQALSFLFEGEDFSRHQDDFFRPFASGGRHRFEFCDSRRGRWFEVRNYRTEHGVLALFSDITAARLEAVELVRQHRLEGLGLLARGFAHDFNNHLTTLTGNISLARERTQDDAELQYMLTEAQAAAARATGLVQQLMTFARGGRPVRTLTRVTDLIRRVLTEHRISHPNIRYQFQGPTEIVAHVDPSQITRLLENLLANSAEAMLDGGVLVVRCHKIRPEEVSLIKNTYTPAEEDYLHIEVIDTGVGMSESELAQVFEPYFTTRKENNATGIGLTVCESIAKAHGGFVTLQSKQGKGTIATFCAPLGRRSEDLGDDIPLVAYPNFSMPILDAAADTRSSTLPGSVSSDNFLVGVRILILEDDAPIRRLMAATLRRAGHEVVETKDGRETVALYADAIARGNRFHLLICDLTIENGMGGVETMRQLRELDPSVLAIVSSGYSDAPAMASPASFGFRGVLPKPYAPSELRAVVHRLLAAHRIIS
jgi:PAS domain S-box-containing protein